MERIQLTGVRKALNGRSVLDGIDFSMERASSAAIVGASGSGKSTLLSILGLLDEPDGGQYVLDGVSMYELNRRERERARTLKVGFIFQRFALLPHLSAFENVLAPFRHNSALRKVLVGPARSRAEEMLARVQGSEFAHRKPRHLSGGEQQRVAIARALVHNPLVVLADEPTGSLDPKTGAKIMDVLVSQVADAGASLIVVTHDRGVAGLLEQTYELTDGRIERRA